MRDDTQGAIWIPEPKVEDAVLFAGVESDVRESGTAEIIGQQDDEYVLFALEFLKKIVRLRGVHIDRTRFLKSELHKRGIAGHVIEQAIAGTPGGAGISPSVLDEIARSAIEFETRKSTAISFTAGLPGGFAMVGTVPADITQFYVHAFRIMQKLAFIYGWQDFLTDADEVDDETLWKFAAFLGVMMGVAGAANGVKNFAVKVAGPALQKQIANKALTKTAWYVPMKQTMRLIGVQVTKQSFAKTVSKVVPVVGGVVSGGLTFVTLRIQSSRLMNHLREIPPPNVDADAYLRSIRLAEEGKPRPTLGESAGGVLSGVVVKLRSVRTGDQMDTDITSDQPPESDSVSSGPVGRGSPLRRRFARKNEVTED